MPVRVPPLQRHHGELHQPPSETWPAQLTEQKPMWAAAAGAREQPRHDNARRNRGPGGRCAERRRGQTAPPRRFGGDVCAGAAPHMSALPAAPVGLACRWHRRGRRRPARSRRSSRRSGRSSRRLVHERARAVHSCNSKPRTYARPARLIRYGWSTSVVRGADGGPGRPRRRCECDRGSGSRPAPAPTAGARRAARSMPRRRGAGRCRCPRRAARSGRR